MKAMSQAPEALDRIATCEELREAVELLERIPVASDLGRSQATGFALALALVEAPAVIEGLWLHSADEDSRAQALDAEMESLVEVFADCSGRVD